MTEGQTDEGFPRSHAVVPPAGRAAEGGPCLPGYPASEIPW